MMTYDQLEALLERLSATITQAAMAMDAVHLAMSAMRREKRQELGPEEWKLIRPMLELTKEMVGKKAAMLAISEREARVKALIESKAPPGGAQPDGYVTSELSAACAKHGIFQGNSNQPPEEK